MSDTRRQDSSRQDPPKPDASRQDPLKRTPPTIDLKAEVVKKDEPPMAKAATGPTAASGDTAKPATPPQSGATSKPATADASAKPATADAPKSDVKAPPFLAASSPSPAAKPVDSLKPSPTTPTASAEASKSQDAAKPADTAEAATPSASATAAAIAATAAASAVKDPKVASTGPTSSSASVAKPGDTTPADAKAAEASKAPTGASSTGPKISDTASAAPSPGPTQSRNAVGAVLTAGFVGGLLGTVLAIGLPRMLPFPPERSVEDRVATMERQVASLPKGPSPLDGRVSALESGLKQAADDARAAKAAAEAAAREASNRPAATQGPDQEARSGLQALSAQVRDNAAKTGAAAAAVDSLGRTTSDRFTAMAKDAETLATHVKSLQADAAALRTSSATIDTRMGESEKRLASVTEGLGRVSTDLAKLSPAAIQAGLRVVVSGRLDDALRSGAPLGPAISALTKLGTDAPSLTPLRPFADKAAPSPAALAAEFKPIATALTTEPVRPDDTWLDKGRRVLGKVVTVQPVGDGSGEDVPSLVARIDASLSRGDVAAAKAAFDKLPADKKSQASAFGETLANRAAAEEASRRIGAQSLATLDAATR
jgi:hypothetical protein